MPTIVRRSSDKDMFAPETSGRFRTNQKVLPTPTALSTRSSAPIDCSSFRLIGSPSPAPSVFFGSSRICGKRCVDGNQTILVWHALASWRRHIRDLGPELEALVTFTAPHKSAMNLFFHACFSYFTQFSIFKSGTRTNSFSLLVTRVQAVERAWAAINMSRDPIGMPLFSK